MSRYLHKIYGVYESVVCGVVWRGSWLGFFSIYLCSPLHNLATTSVINMYVKNMCTPLGIAC